jgi:hypothetical protein
MTTYEKTALDIYTRQGYSALHQYLRGLCRRGVLTAGDAYCMEKEITNDWHNADGGELDISGRND